MSVMVETVRGPVPVESLGNVLAHEHVFVLSTEIMLNFPDEWGDEDARVTDAVQRLSALKAAGIDTIIDPTAIGLGRYIPRIARIAEQIELHIIAATGIYTFNELPHYYARRSLEYMVEHFVRDITTGIADTGIKAGILKCATDRPGVTKDVEKVLRAVAQAHRRTGVPITTHTHAATKRGLEQQEIFLDEGVDLSRVIIGHSGDTDDLTYLEALLANGSYLGMDRFGIDGYLTTEQRVHVVAELCRRGFADRMVLSHDASCYLDWIPGEVDTSATMPNWHYLHISHDVIPMLQQAGVSDGDIDLMLRQNPARLFAAQGGY
ncbi:MAG: phosphotriesterase [Acidimicrobiia bacterium]